MFLRMSFLVVSVITLGAVATGIAFTYVSKHLHDNWWDAIPVVSFWPALGLCFLLAILNGSLTSGSGDDGNPLVGLFSSLFVSLAIAPFIATFIIGWLNDESFTSMPDISYGTAFVAILIPAIANMIVGIVSIVLAAVVVAKD